MDKKPKLQKEFDRKKNIKKFKEKKKKMSADVAMYLEHGEDFPGFDQARRIRGGLAGGGRTNLLEELGRVEAEPSNRNRRAEVSRIHGELNKGYKKGGRIRKGNGGSAAQQHYLQHGYGPTKAKLRSGKPKIAKKGWA